MIALDTNILVRLATEDDPEQLARAQAAVRDEALFIVKTVLVEFAWVLQRGYGKTDVELYGILTALLGQNNVLYEDPQTVDEAMRWFAAGMDFADALHLASAAGVPKFLSFDGGFIQTAAGIDPDTAVVPPPVG